MFEVGRPADVVAVSDHQQLAHVRRHHIVLVGLRAKVHQRSLRHSRVIHFSEQHNGIRAIHSELSWCICIWCPDSGTWTILRASLAMPFSKQSTSKQTLTLQR